ncbi:hypothetical protein CEXT_616841, partial [Caerostris extrusa]
METEIFYIRALFIQLIHRHLLAAKRELFILYTDLLWVFFVLTSRLTSKVLEEKRPRHYYPWRCHLDDLEGISHGNYLTKVLQHLCWATCVAHIARVA